MTHINKVLILVSLYLVFMLAEACDGGINCDCPPVLPYFTIGSYALSSPDKEISSTETLEMDLTMSDLEYVAQAKPCTPKVSWFTTSMYGCSCIGDGYQGLKDELIAIDVFSDKDFSPVHPAGTLLNDLVKSNQYGDQTLKQSIQDGTIQYLISSYNLENFRLYIEQQPEVLGEHNFTVEIHFASGDFESVELSGVNFL